MTTGNLSIQDNETLVQYTSVGEASFVFPFPILENDELKVSRNGALLTFGVDYTITGLGDEGGGSISLLLGASTPGDVWTLWQDMPIERLTGFSAGAATILGAALNAEFSARLRVEQQLRREIRNALRLPPDDTVAGVEMQLPAASVRLGKVQAYSALNGAPELLTLAEVNSSIVALTSSLVRQAIGDGGYLFQIHPAEQAFGLASAQLTFGFHPGDLRRYGSASDGVTDDTNPMLTAIGVGLPILVPQGRTMVPNLDNTVLTSSVKLLGGPGCILDGDGTGFFNFRNPGGTIDEIFVQGVEFTNMLGHVMRCLDSDSLSGALASGGFTTIGKLTLLGNYVHDTNSAFYFGCLVRKYLVHGNRIEDLTAAVTGCYGILVGGNFYPEQTFLDANVNTGTDQITIASHVFSNAQAVNVANNGGALPTGLTAGTTYYVKSINANTVELYSDVGLTAIVNITAAAGGGTHFLRGADEDSIVNLEDCAITSNIFDGLDAQTNSTECHAILVYGKGASIANNLVRNVVNSGNGIAAEGIYTKARFVSITGNHLEDAGTGESYMNVKGNWRNYVSAFGAGQSPPGWGAVVANNTFRQKDTSANHTGMFIASSECQIHHNYFEDMRGSAIETQNGLPYENIEITHNKVKRHRGQRAFYIRHWGSGFKCNDNTIHDFRARSSLTDVAMIEALGTASQGNWTDWEFCRNKLRDEGTCEATVRLRCLQLAPNTFNTATHLQIIGNSMQNQQPAIAELGLNISTGTYTNLIVKDNDALLVDGAGTQFNRSGTITSAQFDGNRFTDRFMLGSVNVEEWHCNSIASNSGAGAAARTYVLPPAVVGQEFTFVREDAGTMDVDPDGAERIVGTTGAGATVTLNAVGASLTVRCRVAGFWVAISAHNVTFN